MSWPSRSRLISRGCQGSPWFATRARITHDHWVNVVAFSPDSQFLATASDDKTARIWSTALDDMLHQLCTGHGRNLSLGEWRRYLGDLRWQPTCENWPTPEN
jgi:WD40 repeat protein